MANNTEVRSPVGTRPNGTWVRYATSAIATWLLLSAFLWTHTSAQRLNTWVIGALMLVAALAAAAVPKLRFTNTVLSAWLFFSTIGLGGYTATVVNNLVVAVVVLVLSLMPPVRTPGATVLPRRRPPAH